MWGVRGLDLGRNSLQALPAGVGRWTAITSLSVAGNGLAALHPSLGLCVTLQAPLPPLQSPPLRSSHASTAAALPTVLGLPDPRSIMMA